MSKTSNWIEHNLGHIDGIKCFHVCWLETILYWSQMSFLSFYKSNSLKRKKMHNLRSQKRSPLYFSVTAAERWHRHDAIVRLQISLWGSCKAASWINKLLQHNENNTAQTEEMKMENALLINCRCSRQGTKIERMKPECDQTIWVTADDKTAVIKVNHNILRLLLFTSAFADFPRKSPETA